jgi:excisionase family DNA binding protein
MIMQQYYTISQFAKALGVTNMTVYRWIEQGKVKTIEVVGKRMIPAEELKPKEKGE